MHRFEIYDVQFDIIITTFIHMYIQRCSCLQIPLEQQRDNTHCSLFSIKYLICQKKVKEKYIDFHSCNIYFHFRANTANKQSIHQNNSQ